jgi:putative tricarboxylic transport membrane protein
MKIKAPRDFWAGLMFMVFGLGFLIVAGNYAMGTAVRMGPAYFPTVLGGLHAVLGFAIFIQSFFVKGEKVPPIVFRPMTLIVLAIVLFGVLLKPLGLIVATGLLIAIGALGGHEFKTKEVVILFVVLAVFAVAIFVKGLGLPIPVCPAVLDDWCRGVHIGN